jgi:hypothetical protein
VKWWTRKERIRTEAEIPFEVALREEEITPLYQAIAKKAHELYQGGMKIHAIAREIKADDKTIKKAINWLSSNKKS